MTAISQAHLPVAVVLVGLAAAARPGAVVTAIARHGHDPMPNDARADAPFVVRHQDAGCGRGTIGPACRELEVVDARS
jgi:hypothetical protein